MNPLSLDCIKEDFETAITEFLSLTKLKNKEIIVMGCSTSQIQGCEIGTMTSPEIAKTLLNIIIPKIIKYRIFLAVQCCEHLNRALVVDKKCATTYNLPIVTVVPHPGAGGALASCYYRMLESPVLVEEIQADAGIDIGNTIIGMHLKKVAIPVNLSIKKIGEANLIAANVRPKLIGGKRAMYL